MHIDINCILEKVYFSVYKFFQFGHSVSFPSKNAYMTVPACSITQDNPFGFSFQTHMTDGIILVADGPVSHVANSIRKFSLVQYFLIFIHFIRLPLLSYAFFRLLNSLQTSHCPFIKIGIFKQVRI